MLTLSLQDYFRKKNAKEKRVKFSFHKATVLQFNKEANGFDEEFR